MFESIKEIVDYATQHQMPLWEVMIEQEMKVNHTSRELILDKMSASLLAMENAYKRGTTGQGVFSPTGLTGGDAVKMRQYRQAGRTLSGNLTLAGVEAALATNEVNAAMGVICATPTAGASGTLPGVLVALDEQFHLSHEQKLNLLFVASLFGMVTANNAMIAGAAGGCQAEVGSASAMSAAAAVAIMGGSPQASSHAFAMALGNLLGLVCDPVAGLVEIPCVKRNTIGATNALICADMALAGIENVIPADEVIDAMRRIGKNMPRELRETGLGGLAGTPTGNQIKLRIFGKEV
ncbi:L-serine ammonia-lyase, iron-sulfur-dependent, subunit alpha [Vaginisenegalia massiliensis]|uniref:L-serine ammonia-lyase, iron-sulfur-dependent, subunit alpha n=1 Tax=Vaginisenegalia massiliensis TaxID=2058294 RepID=UPI000F54488F|nr:L-serine ammonia-lyase, iron-sulfur-dependent, subunit alpha [Vaginisenegalia massiliensis]